MADDEGDIVARLDAAADHHSSPCADGEMVWRSWGEGIPLVLLHGGAGSWRHWVRNIEFYARSYRVIAPDTPGLGDSAIPPDPTNGSEIAAIIGAGLDRLIGPVGRYHLVGFSFGGLLAATLATQHTDRLHSLTLVGSGGMGGPRPPLKLEKIRNRTGDDRIAAHRANLAILMFADPARIDTLALAIQNWNSDHTRLNSVPFHAEGAVPKALATIKMPVNGIWGEFDASAGPYQKDREDNMRRLRPDIDYRVIEGAGHWVAYEAAERFNPMLLEMLRR